MTYEEEVCAKWDRRGTMENTYSMNETYNASDLYIANIVYLTNNGNFKFFETEDLKVSSKKYIFRKLDDEKYQEVFTGFETIEWQEFSKYTGVPFIHQIEKFDILFPETHNQELTKMDLIISLNYVDEKSKLSEEKTVKNNFDDYDAEKQNRDTAAVKKFTKSSIFKKIG